MPKPKKDDKKKERRFYSKSDGSDTTIWVISILVGILVLALIVVLLVTGSRWP